jgi:RNA polymerase sigma factor (sigma-70 family)
MNIGKEGTNARETFARLYDEHMPKVYRYIYYKVNDQELAEDLTANVFEKALVNFAKYSSDKASFSTWVFAIARNTIADHYRAQPKVNVTSIDEAVDMPSREPGPEDVTEDDEEKQVLRVCITRLLQDEQEIVRLKFAMEMTNRDIARATGLTESNVGVKLYRIVRKLRESFQESQHG